MLVPPRTGAEGKTDGESGEESRPAEGEHAIDRTKEGCILEVGPEHALQTNDRAEGDVSEG
jgi:hypothetical protein